MATSPACLGTSHIAILRLRSLNSLFLAYRRIPTVHSILPPPFLCHRCAHDHGCFCSTSTFKPGSFSASTSSSHATILLSTRRLLQNLSRPCLCSLTNPGKTDAIAMRLSVHLRAFLPRRPPSHHHGPHANSSRAGHVIRLPHSGRRPTKSAELS